MTDLNDADIVECEQEVPLGGGVGRSVRHIVGWENAALGRGRVGTDRLIYGRWDCLHLSWTIHAIP